MHFCILNVIICTHSPYRIVMSLIIASLAVGRTASFAPDIASAKISAKKIFSIIDRVSDIVTDSKHGLKPVRD